MQNEISEDDENTRQLKSILSKLNMATGDIEASAVTTSDGLIKAAMLGDEIDPDRFGAMCATLLALSKRAADETGRGELKLLLIEGTKGTVLIVQIGVKGVLALAAKPKSNLGMIFLEARRTAEKISEFL
ncbi:hypothetical protein MNBD_GAMMA06-230 [hydrothermal vent metagenome]|uniref:Roadblock/LAMTOR2 domain-containing protein n=1 Tax=hydrothermal vent metagenome TaxID=652676 RepID=A0A3B0W8E9_9ZZZZ